MTDTPALNWPRPIRWLHWVTVALVVAAWILAETAEDRDSLMVWHHSVGVLVGLMVLTRILIRVLLPSPPPPAGWAGRAATAVHVVLLLLLLLQVGSGLMSVWWEGDAVTVFGQTLASPFGYNERRAEFFEDLHEDVLWNLFSLLLLAHASAALFHHFMLGDNILRRMLGRAR